MKKLLSLLTTFVVAGSSVGGLSGFLKANSRNLDTVTAVKANGIPQKMLSGYIYYWADLVSTGDVNPAYNVLNVSFLFTNQPDVLPSLAWGITSHADQIKAGIKKQHEAGHLVMLSLGGATGAAMRLSRSQQPAFEAEVSRIVKEYNFDGIDVDLEGNSLKQTYAPDNLYVVSKTLNDLKTKAENEGGHFYISSAPEFPYLRPNSHADFYNGFLKETNYDWVQPQFYNQSDDGITVTEADQKTFGVPGWLTQNDKAHKAEFLYLINKYIADGTDHQFTQIPADKLLIGLPATENAASDGFATPTQIKQTYEFTKEYKLNLRGLMTWAINLDAKSGYQFAKAYLDSFGS